MQLKSLSETAFILFLCYSAQLGFITSCHIISWWDKSEWINNMKVCWIFCNNHWKSFCTFDLKLLKCESLLFLSPIASGFHEFNERRLWFLKIIIIQITVIWGVQSPPVFCCMSYFLCMATHVARRIGMNCIFIFHRAAEPVWQHGSQHDLMFEWWS